MQDAVYGQILYGILLDDLMPPRIVLGAGQSAQEAVEVLAKEFPWFPRADIEGYVEAIFARRERF